MRNNEKRVIMGASVKFPNEYEFKPGLNIAKGSILTIADMDELDGIVKLRLSNPPIHDVLLQFDLADFNSEIESQKIQLV